jgi:hypothetical protein
MKSQRNEIRALIPLNLSPCFFSLAPIGGEGWGERASRVNFKSFATIQANRKIFIDIHCSAMHSIAMQSSIMFIL